MPVKGKKKSKDRAWEKETAPSTSVVTRSKTKKDNAEIALALAKFKSKEEQFDLEY
jgi:hypothetical protein